MIAALIFSLLSGALLAALVCKGIHLKLWLDVFAGLAAVGGTWAAAILAGSSTWPLAGLASGFAGVVAWLRIRRAAV